MKNILLTGAPGTGKTTAMRKVVNELPGEARGFYTQEIRSAGRRTGFEIVTLSGKRAVLASTEIDSPQRVGRYGVDVAAFEKTGVAELQAALSVKELIVIDEIGKMELFSDKFKEVVRTALDAPNLVLATITQSQLPFVTELKQRPDIHLLRLDSGNRDSLHSTILNLISGGEPA